MEKNEYLDKPDPSNQDGKKISNAAIKVAIGGVLSLLAGLAAQVVTAYLFGAGFEMDAFFTALTIPVYLQIVLLGGLPFVVIPAFVHEETSGNEDNAWNLAGTFIWMTAIVLFIAATMGAIFSSQIIALTAPGFGVEKSALASQMLSILMFTIPFIGLGTFTSGVENARSRFFWPAVATAVGSLGNVLTILILQPVMRPYALAWGNLVSAILFAAMTTVPVLRHGWKKSMSLKDPRMLEMIRLIAPFIIFGLITNGRMVLERYFASTLPDGDLSYIGYAGKISNIFVILLATSIASAIFPVMARAFSTQGISGLVKQADYGVRITLALALPAVMITSVLAFPMVKTFFERGAFLPQATLSVGVLIPIVMINDVLFRMVNNMIGRTFFVLKDTLTTNLISSVTILFYILAAKVFTGLWGYVGLALAQPIQAGLGIMIMGTLLFRRVKQFSVMALFKSFLLFTSISLAAALFGWGAIQLTAHFPTIVQLGVAGLLSCAVYLGLLYLFDRSTAISIMDMVGMLKIYSIVKTRFTLVHDAPPI